MKLRLEGKAQIVFRIIERVAHPERMGEGQLHRVCAWCGKHMGYKPGGSGETHGICDVCAEQQSGRKEEECKPS